MPKNYDEVRQNVQAQLQALLRIAVQARMYSHDVNLADATEMKHDDGRRTFAPRVPETLKVLMKLYDSEYLEDLTQTAFLEYLKAAPSLAQDIYYYYENRRDHPNPLERSTTRNKILEFVKKEVLKHLFRNLEVRQILFKKQLPRGFKYDPITDDISYVNKHSGDGALVSLLASKGPKANDNGVQFVIRNSNNMASYGYCLNFPYNDLSSEPNKWLIKEDSGGISFHIARNAYRMDSLDDFLKGSPVIKEGWKNRTVAIEEFRSDPCYLHQRFASKEEAETAAHRHNSSIIFFRATEEAPHHLCIGAFKVPRLVPRLSFSTIPLRMDFTVYHVRPAGNGLFQLLKSNTQHKPNFRDTRYSTPQRLTELLNDMNIGEIETRKLRTDRAQAFVTSNDTFANNDEELFDVDAKLIPLIDKLLTGQLKYCIPCGANNYCSDETLQSFVLQPDYRAIQQTQGKLQRTCDNLEDMLLIRALFFTTAHTDFSKHYDDLDGIFTELYRTSGATQITSIKKIKGKYSQLIDHMEHPLHGVESLIEAGTIDTLCAPIANTDLPHKQRIAHLLLYWVESRSHGCQEEKSDADSQEDFPGFSVLMRCITTDPDTSQFKPQQVIQLLTSLCIQLAVGDYEAPKLDAALNTLKGWFTKCFADDSAIKDEVEWRLSARNIRQLKEVQRQGHLTSHAQLTSSKLAQRTSFFPTPSALLPKHTVPSGLKEPTAPSRDDFEQNSRPPSYAPSTLKYS